MKKIKIALMVTAVLMILLVVATAIFLTTGYDADDAAISAFEKDALAEQYSIENIGVVYEPEDPAAGLIFYPGGKVEYSSYSPLMTACAERDILCVLLEMPFDLAVFDTDAAEGISKLFPEIENWYIGGHSHGGAMASYYLAENADKYKGLILLGSYSAIDLSYLDLKVLSVYGSKDKILNIEKYAKNRVFLPDEFTEMVIEGGNHAGFGMYGEQDGDGPSTITNEEQIYITAEAIEKMIKGTP